MTATNAVTRHIIEYILGIGGFAWRNSVGAVDLPHRFVRFGYPGSGDVLAVVEGRFYSIEVKTGRDQVRDSQRRWMESVRRAGGVCLVAHTADDVSDYFESKRKRKRSAPERGGRVAVRIEAK